uniref:(northern house mosquito) hypothetical protein n=1 Tax=Culex pipiens TaxID=7175 RepID=A0A8D8FT27_CULPI
MSRGEQGLRARGQQEHHPTANVRVRSHQHRRLPTLRPHPRPRQRPRGSLAPPALLQRLRTARANPKTNRNPPRSNRNHLQSRALPVPHPPEADRGQPDAAARHSGPHWQATASRPRAARHDRREPPRHADVAARSGSQPGWG